MISSITPKKLSYIAGVMCATTVFLTATPKFTITLAYFSMVVYFVAFLFLFWTERRGVILSAVGVGALLALGLVVFISTIKLAWGYPFSYLVNSWVYFLTFISFYLISFSVHFHRFVNVFCLVSCIYGGVLFVLVLLGWGISSGGVVLENYPSALMIPYFLVRLSRIEKMDLFQMFFAVIILVVSVLTDSRAPQLLLLICVFYVILRGNFFSLYKIFNVFLLVASVLLVGLTIFSDDVFWGANEALTNRPAIWRFYFEGVESKAWGAFHNMEYLSEDTSGYLSELHQRGFADKYGAHSSYIKLFSESGVFGVLALVGLLLGLIGLSHRNTAIMASYAIVTCFLTSTSVGQWTVYGFFLALCVVMIYRGRVMV